MSSSPSSKLPTSPWIFFLLGSRFGTESALCSSTLRGWVKKHIRAATGFSNIIFFFSVIDHFGCNLLKLEGKYVFFGIFLTNQALHVWSKAAWSKCFY